jgi:hypothetical protein
MILTKGEAVTIDEFIDKKKELEMKKIEALRDLWKNSLMDIVEEVFYDLEENPLDFDDFEQITEDYTNAYGSFFYNPESNQWEEVPY